MSATRYPCASIHARNASKRTSRLRVEQLEDRDVPSSVSGTIFNDANKNEIYDGGETGLAGWTAFIDNDRNGILESGETSTTTDANGDYFIDTTTVAPFIGSSGTQYDYVAFFLETGTGGRWQNTTASYKLVNRDTTPTAIDQNFGALFRTDADAGFKAVGAEQLVNEVTAGTQGQSGASVSADAAGDYVAAWRTSVPGGNDILTARVFNADGTPRTSDLTIATPVSTASGPIIVDGPPIVSMADNNGQFAIAWTAINPSNGAFNAYVSTYSLNGTQLTGPTSIASSTNKIRNFVAGIAADANGNFVTLYSQYTQDHFGAWGHATYYAQRFSSSGTATGKAINVVTPLSANSSPSVAMVNNGDFVVVYDDVVKGVSSVNAQRYTAAGQKTGSLIKVASTSSGIVWFPALSMNSTGQFAVTFHDRDSGNHFVRIYNANGTPTGDAINVAQGAPYSVGLALDDFGNATLSWTDSRGAGAYRAGEVHVQRLDAGATTPLLDTLANTTTQGTQGGGYNANPVGGAALVATGNGSFIAVWTGNGPGDETGIFAQHFGPL